VRAKAIPGLSGTLGIDRTFPARYGLEITDYQGLTAADVWNLVDAFGGVRPAEAGDKLPERLVISITHKDPQAIKPGMRIRIVGYRVMGDEGGTWTEHKQLEILAPVKK
jgi:hypothetical protein